MKEEQIHEIFGAFEDIEQDFYHKCYHLNDALEKWQSIHGEVKCDIGNNIDRLKTYALLCPSCLDEQAKGN